jgi:hypothetical protein
LPKIESDFQVDALNNRIIRVCQGKVETGLSGKTGSSEFVREKWRPVFPEKQDRQSLSGKSGDRFFWKDKRKPKAWGGKEIVGMETA